MRAKPEETYSYSNLPFPTLGPSRSPVSARFCTVSSVPLPDDRNHEVSTGYDSDADLQAVRTVGPIHGNNDMHNSLRSCHALTSPLARLIHSLATVIAAFILLGSTTLAQSAPGSGREVSANELARRVVTNELKFQDQDGAQWMYRQEKEESGKKQVVRIVETKNGSLSRLLSINGHPLTAKQLQKENLRIKELVNLLGFYRECSGDESSE